MHAIFATGALRKFMDARERGASREELTRLSKAAMAEQEKSRVRPSTRPAPPSGPSKTEAAVSHRSNVLEFIDRAKFDRSRLEREWESAPE
jgi:hypothetical protein